MVNDRKFSQKIMSTFSTFEKSAKYNFQLVDWRATVSSWNVSIKKGAHLKVVMLNFGYDNHDEQIRRSGGVDFLLVGTQNLIFFLLFINYRTNCSIL